MYLVRTLFWILFGLGIIHTAIVPEERWEYNPELKGYYKNR